MANLILLVICFVAGIVLRRNRKLPNDTAAVLNSFIIHISLPSLVLLHMHRLPLEVNLISAALAPWLMFGLGVALFVVAGRYAGWARPTTGGLILTGSLANTSFVGLPMIETFYGTAFLSIGILIDQLGTYLVLSTAGIIVAALFAAQSGESGSRVTAGQIARKIATFPPFLALIVALLLRPVDFPPEFEDLLGRLGGTLAPLALVSVGFQLRLEDLGGRLQPLCLGLLFQLILGPLLVGLFLIQMIGNTGPIARVTVFELAMAPQIGAAVVAMDNKLDAKLVTLMVGLGIPLSFLTLPIWWYLLQSI
jgi:predicted permease